MILAFFSSAWMILLECHESPAREGYGLSLVSAFKKAIKNIEVKVDVKRGGPKV
jgi:hypothetical protein